MTGVPAVRPFRDSDWGWVYDICVETAGAGQGVRGRYSTDELVPDAFAGPYLYLEPRHAYVLDNGARAVGYVIGTPDTSAFVARYLEHWLPRVSYRYLPLSPASAEERQRLDSLFHPEVMLRPELAPYPAHLHVNLLAGYRGSGWGRALIGRFLASVAAAGATSCHLAVRPANTAARAFYARLGWTPVPSADTSALYFARPTVDTCAVDE